MSGEPMTFFFLGGGNLVVCMMGFKRRTFRYTHVRHRAPGVKKRGEWVESQVTKKLLIYAV